MHSSEVTTEEWHLQYSIVFQRTVIGSIVLAQL